ncbi:MAG: hypothetical protein AAB486_04055 [Patescibacteria group bacterium]
MALTDVLILLISGFISLRVFFPQLSPGPSRGRLVNELFLTTTILLPVLALVFLLLYDFSLLNILLVVVIGLAAWSLLVEVGSGILRALALASFAAMTAAFLLKLNASAEIFAVFSFSLLLITFLKDLTGGGQNEP